MLNVYCSIVNFPSYSRPATARMRRQGKVERGFLPHHLLAVLDEDAVHGLPRQAAALEVEGVQRGRSGKGGSGDAVRHEVCVTLT